MPMQIPNTPVLQSQSTTMTTMGLRGHSVAVITASKRKRYTIYTKSSPNEQQIEVPVLSWTAAEQEMQDSESGSVMLFVHSEPVQGRSGMSSSGHRFHRLYISFKFRMSKFHVEYPYVNLKAMPQSRRTSRLEFDLEQKQFDIVNELHTVFVPAMREKWLLAIVKAANFMDQPVESVDLKTLLRHRHHLILTRCTQKSVSVVLCKSDPDTKKIQSTSIDFDFKARRVKDDTGNPLRSFHEAYQIFLGYFNHAHQLMPSPREEDEEEPLPGSLLEGLQAESSPKTKLRYLLRLQGIIRQEQCPQRSGEMKPEMFELWTTFLLPQLMDSTSRTIGGTTPANSFYMGGVSGSGEAASASNSTLAITTLVENGLGTSDLALEAPFNDIQVLVCDILADLCDLRVDSVGPHVWRMCKGYLEDAANWHACLAALELLTLMSNRLAEWLVQNTDAGMQIFSVFVEAQQFLVVQREAAQAACGKSSQQMPQRLGQPRAVDAWPSAGGGNGASASSGCSRKGSIEEQSRRQAFPTAMPNNVDQDVGLACEQAFGSRWGEPSMRRERSRQAPCSGVEWSGSRMAANASRPRSVRRSPSFDNFEDANPGLDDATPGNALSGCSHIGADDAMPLPRRRRGDSPSEDNASLVSNAAQDVARGEARTRPVRVPPLNLNLAAKLPGAGSVKALPQEGAASGSMTRSSRRLRLQEMRNPLPPQAPLALGSASRTSGSSRLASSSSSHTASAPSLSLRLLNPSLSCMSASATPAVASSQVGVIKVGSQFSAAAEKQAVTQADELSKTLGEACLLADLSHILKHKQERKVEEAVMEHERKSLVSPCKSAPGNLSTSRASGNSSVRAPSGSAQVGASPKVSSPADASSALRMAGRPQIPGAVPPPTMGSSGSFPSGSPSSGGAPMFVGSGGSIVASAAPSVQSSSSSHAAVDSRSPRLAAFRRVRLHACLVLEHFCACAPDPARSLGQFVPVNKLFEMLYSSVTQRGGCSFALDEDVEGDHAPGIAAGSSCGSDAGENRHSRGLLQQRLRPWRLQRMVHMHDRLQRSALSRRCVCAAPTAPRSGVPEDLCTCVDDVLASCIWRFLRVYALHVEAFQTSRVPVPSFRSQDVDDSRAAAIAWDRHPNAWNIRSCLDMFLVRIEKACGQVLLQLQSAQRNVTAGPELVASLQHRLAFLLRLCSTYTKHCSSRVLPLQVFHTVNPLLLAVKKDLCMSRELDNASQLSPPALSLWVAYLQLVGTLMRCSRSGGAQRSAFGETLLVLLLDFSASGASAHAGVTPSISANSPPPPSSAPLARSGVNSPAPPKSGGHARPMGRSTSLRSLTAVSGAPPRLPTSSGSTTNSPRTVPSDRSPSSAKVNTGPRGAACNVCELLPRILERALCDGSLDDVVAAKPKAAAGEESLATIRCRVLAFVEALLDFAQTVPSTRGGQSLTTGPEVGDVSGDSNTERMERSQKYACGASGTLGAHEAFRSSLVATSAPLVHSLLEWLQFLFLPPSGLLCRLGRTWEKTPLDGGKIVTQLVLCERSLFRVPVVADAVYVTDSHVADYYVRRHFLLFVRLYNSTRMDGPTNVGQNAQLTRLCCLHLQTLMAIAQLRTEAELPRRAFHQLSVLDFLAGEVDLEHETTQMRHKFLRQQRQASRASAGSSSSAGSCTSSPSNPTGGRGCGSGSGPLALAQYLQGVSHAQTPPMPPPFPAPPAVEDRAGTDDRTSAQLTVNSATSTSAVSSADDDGALSRGGPPMAVPAPMPIRPAPFPTKKFVPKLHFGGLRPSLQGCSGLGALPPEEPGQPVYEAPHTIAAATQPALVAPCSVPNLSFAGLGESRGQLAVGSTLAPVNEPGGSGTESTVASPGATPDRAGISCKGEEQATQGSLVDTSGEWTEAEGQLLFEVSYSQDWFSVMIAQMTKNGIVSEAERQRLLIIDRFGEKLECFSSNFREPAMDVFPLQCKEPDSTPSTEAPRRSPPVVPKLLIGTHAPGPIEAGEHGGQNPPTSRSSPRSGGDRMSDRLPDSGASPVATPTTPFSSTGGSARPGALGSGRRHPGAPPPPISAGAALGLASASALRPAAAPSTAVAPPPLGQNGTPVPGSVHAQSVSAPHVEPDSSDDSSDDDRPERVVESVPVAEAKAPAQASVPALTATRISVPPPVPQIGARVGGAVPKLSFSGLRPSLQGTSGLGAPPPEEPGQQTQMPLMMQAAPVPTQPTSLLPAPGESVPLSPPPPSHSDSSSSGAPTPPAPPAEDPSASGAAIPSASPDQPDEPPEVDSSDEDMEGLGELQAAPQPPASSAPPPPSFAPGAVREADDCALGDADCIPPMPVLFPSTMPGLPGAAGAGGLRQPPLAAVPKLSFNGLRPSLQGCSALFGAPPAEENTRLALASPAAPAAKAPMQEIQALSLRAVSEAAALEPATSTPTGSGYLSPTANSAASVPTTAHTAGLADLPHYGVVNQNLFYFEGRQRRRIYEDYELHSLMLTLILTLLLTPKRGLLDPRYVDQFPLSSHKRNVLFLLGFHLNHGANRGVLPWLSQQVESISHFGGLRLLKLLCETTMHRWMYSNQERIAGGQFGTVYQAEVQLSEPGKVAVKQIPKQSSIQDRCVFMDVFSEIACLDAVRFEDNVCQIFDYGVDHAGYWIVMKYYPTNLRKWREALQGTVDDNLPRLLCVYRLVLKALHVLHRHGVIHYDLKCDNIMIEPDRALDGDPAGICIPEASDNGNEHERSNASNSGAIDYSPGRVPRDEQIPCIAVADFGESRMMASSEDLDMRSRGTEVIKCPEMLEIMEKVEGSRNYDRRKRAGTNQAADVWSLGCLFFELLTGCYLFQDDDPATHFVRLTGKKDGKRLPVMTEANIRLLEGNMPLVEFIRFMLVREKQQRPSIAAAMKKFEEYACEALRFTSRHGEVPASLLPRRESTTSLDSPHGSVARSIGSSAGGRSHSRSDQPRPNPNVCEAFGETDSYFTKVFSDLCVLEVSDEDLRLLADDISDLRVSGNAIDAVISGSSSPAVGTLRPLLGQYLWTHVVDFRVAGAPRLPFQPEVNFVLQLPWSSPSRTAEDFVSFLPTIFDFLRHAAITRGVVLLVDGYSTEERSSVGHEASGAPDAATQAAAPTSAPTALAVSSGTVTGRNGLAMAAVLALVVETYQMAVFPALSHLSSQLLIVAVRPDVVWAMARWQESKRRAAWHQREGAVRVACVCGSCSWYIPTAWLDAGRATVAMAPTGDLGSEQTSPGQHARAVACSCSPNTPAAGKWWGGNCESYLRWLRARFGFAVQSVHWLELPEGVSATDSSDGPFVDGSTGGDLTRPLHSQAVPVAETRSHQDDANVRVQRFRCRSCQVLTHAEIRRGSQPPCVALVTSYEKLRCTATFDGDLGASEYSRRCLGDDVETQRASGNAPPPSCFRDARLEQVMLPRAQTSSNCKYL